MIEREICKITTGMGIPTDEKECPGPHPVWADLGYDAAPADNEEEIELCTNLVQ
jgi:hypothetical protein